MDFRDSFSVTVGNVGLEFWENSLRLCSGHSNVVNGFVVYVKRRKDSAPARSKKFNGRCFIPNDEVRPESFEQNKHVPGIAHAVEVAAEMSTDIVSITSVESHTDFDGVQRGVNMIDFDTGAQVGGPPSHGFEHPPDF